MNLDLERVSIMGGVLEGCLDLNIKDSAFKFTNSNYSPVDWDIIGRLAKFISFNSDSTDLVDRMSLSVVTSNSGESLFTVSKANRCIIYEEQAVIFHGGLLSRLFDTLIPYFLGVAHIPADNVYVRYDYVSGAYDFFELKNYSTLSTNLRLKPTFNLLGLDNLNNIDRFVKKHESGIIVLRGINPEGLDYVKTYLKTTGIFDLETEYSLVSGDFEFFWADDYQVLGGLDVNTHIISYLLS